VFGATGPVCSCRNAPSDFCFLEAGFPSERKDVWLNIDKHFQATATQQYPERIIFILRLSYAADPQSHRPTRQSMRTEHNAKRELGGICPAIVAFSVTPDNAPPCRVKTCLLLVHDYQMRQPKEEKRTSDRGCGALFVLPATMCPICLRGFRGAVSGPSGLCNHQQHE
jgi:hypothetical protein